MYRLFKQLCIDRLDSYIKIKEKKLISKKMSSDDGNDRRVYVGNLPPDIRNKVFYILI